MRAALLVESLTGNTWKAAELIAGGLTQEGWSITSLTPVNQPDHAAIQDADIVLVGTWVHGLFVVGQFPWAAARISNLPAMRGKRSAVFCTVALNPGKTLDKLTALPALPSDPFALVRANAASAAFHLATNSSLSSVRERGKPSSVKNDLTWPSNP